VASEKEAALVSIGPLRAYKKVPPRPGARIDMKRTLLSWSSGKDSAWSLYLLRKQNDCEVVGLLTTFNQEANRVAMHAVRRILVEAQAEEAGIPLWDVDLP
jgi:7-cyano-7-deazaguanine synthase in queuosine biosynthesis